MKHRTVAIIALSVVFTFTMSAVAFAHGTEPRLELGMQFVNPGGVVDVRGVDFEREELITLTLINAQANLPFGEIVADVEGVFLHTLTIPVELSAGVYVFLAVTDDHKVVSPELTVQGAPILNPEGGHGEGERDEDDPLLAPMPTFPPGVVPGGVVFQPTPRSSPTATPAPIPSQNSTSVLPIVLAIAAVLILAAFLIMRRR